MAVSFANLPEIPTVNFEGFHFTNLGKAVVVDLPVDSHLTAEQRFAQFEDFRAKIPRQKWKGELSAWEVADCIEPVQLVISSLRNWGLGLEKVGVIARNEGSVQEKHVDNAATTRSTAATILLGFAHNGLFSVYRHRYMSPVPVTRAVNTPNRMVIVRQKPFKTAHSATTFFSQADSQAGFDQRLLFSFDCVER